MKHLVGFQMNVFNYHDFSFYWIPEEHFFKEAAFNCTGTLEIVSESKKTVS